MKNKLLVSLVLTSLLMAGSASANEAGLINDPVSKDGTAVVYEYSPVNQFLVNARLGYVTDIELKPGEEVQKIASGNTVQWSVEKDSVAGTSHVYIKPSSQSATNFIINTNQRSYRLIVTTYNNDLAFIVKWNYPAEDEQARLLALRKKTEEEQAKLQAVLKTIRRAKLINKHYEVKKNKNVVNKYIPLSVFDDGRKTYIEISKDNTQNMPVLFYFDEYDKSKLQMVNYRLKGNFMEVDRVMDRIIMVFSQKSYLIFEKDDKSNKVPSPDEIKLNKDPNVVLAAKSVSSGRKQNQKVDFYATAPISLKQKMEAKRKKEQLDIIKASNPAPADDSLNRLANILEDEGQEDENAPDRSPDRQGGGTR